MYIQLVLQKDIRIPKIKQYSLCYNPNIPKHCIIQSWFSRSKLVDLFEKYSLFFSFEVQFETIRCLINIKLKTAICYASVLDKLSHIWVADLKVASSSWYIITENLPSMQNHTFIPDGLLHDTLYLEGLQNGYLKEGDT